jgi:hypothetical protein
VIAYTPGLTPGTQLTRNQSLVFRLIHALVMRILSATRSMNTVAGGGDLLADLALGHIVPPTGRLYALHVKRHLTWPDISELASDDGVMTKLWRDSAALIGFPGE